MKKVFRSRILLYTACLAAAALSIIVSLRFEGFQRSYLLGGGIGMGAVALFRLVRLVYRLRKDPQKALCDYRVSNEERAVFISNRSMAQTLYVLYLLLLVACAIAMALDAMPVFWTLYILLLVALLLYGIFLAVNNKKY